MLFSAFLLGILGSLHCIGMCGPIALALPRSEPSALAAAGSALLYNAGRIMTYMLLGLIIGAFGRGLFLAGVQAWFSVLIGISLLLVALLSLNIESYFKRFRLVAMLHNWVSRSMATMLHREGWQTTLGIGVLNGLLPCGLVYVAIAGAVLSDTWLQSALYMGAFGAGTLPLMLGTALAGQFISLNWRQRLRRLSPILLGLFGLFFIARGVNFHLPETMRFWEIGQEVPICH
jgi:uncharacterized protein